MKLEAEEVSLKREGDLSEEEKKTEADLLEDLAEVRFLLRSPHIAPKY
jgi:hypothetical protein